VKQGLECARRTPPQLCEKDPDGGHCVTATEDELACIVNCVKLGNPPGATPKSKENVHTIPLPVSVNLILLEDTV
jgi:hypothetical protein